VAGRPLRPATDHRLGRPLPHQRANRTQAPPSASRKDPFLTRATPKRAYAELPRVSAGYPPPMGRFPTCSSPVRHGYPRRDPVRLACIRHAASVNPEPGSNSPPKCCACLPERSPGLCFTCARSSLDGQRSHLRKDDPRHVGPPSSAARLDSSPLRLFPREHPVGFDPGSQLVNVRAPFTTDARAKENRPVEGGHRQASTSHVSALIVSDDLQSGTLRSPARAQFGACQHLLTEGDYRHVRA
jgi:hypothetical protein